MNNIKETTIGELVTNDFRAADVFTAYGIDFCCGGNISVSEACRDKGINVDELNFKLQNLINSSNVATHDFKSWDVAFLADYIKNIHHKYVLEAIPQILPLAQKVADVHGENHAEVIKINELFIALKNELLSHMKDEEELLFPRIKSMSDSKKEEGNNSLDSIKSIIENLEDEHQNAGAVLKELAGLSNNYVTPVDACNTYRVLFGKLKEFENDLHRHIHLENNILFTKVIEIEQRIIF